MSHVGDVLTTEYSHLPATAIAAFRLGETADRDRPQRRNRPGETRARLATPADQPMDFYPEIIHFANECRLFPLPDLVLFPHALLPLHIFEPRYRQMTTDALASDRLVTIVQILSASEGSRWSEPVPIVDVGCLGKIIQHERLADGRYNIIVLGLRRVRLKKEKPSAKLYRIAQAEILEDQESDQPLEQERGELIGLFRALFERRQCLDENLSALLDSGLPLGVLSDIIAHALRLPSPMKQSLLSEPHVARRVESLRTILHQIAEQEESKAAFPPPFSMN